jgi:hypothetical protein
MFVYAFFKITNLFSKIEPKEVQNTCIWYLYTVGRFTMQYINSRFTRLLYILIFSYVVCWVNPFYFLGI